LPGQSGRTQPAGKTQPSPRSISRLRSTDSSETLEIAGVPCRLPLDRSSVPKTYSIKRNRKSTLKSTFLRTPPKTTKSQPFRRFSWSKITKQRGTRSSYVTSNNNPSKKRSQNFSKEIPRKGSENHQAKTEEHKQALRNHAESSIHTMKVHTRSSFRPIIHPFHKISPLSSQASLRNPKGNRKGKIAKQNDLGF
jgi:hypothetical protein